MQTRGVFFKPGFTGLTASKPQVPEYPSVEAGYPADGLLQANS